jgi:hypothetical protein
MHPGSFVCTGGTEYSTHHHHVHSNIVVRPKREIAQSTPESQNTSQKSRITLTVDKTMIKHSTDEESKSSVLFSPNYLNEDSPCGPMAYFDECNRKVVIISSEPSL